MATNYEIDQCLKALAVAYPYYDKQQANPDMALKIFHRVLADVDFALLDAATLQWLSTARPFHPTPGELRDLALTLVERDEKSADEAWAEVVQVRNRIGSYGVPTWSSPRIDSAVKAFGRWKEFCAIDDDQMQFVRAQFMKIYDAQGKRCHDDRLMLPAVRNAIQGRIAQLAQQKALQPPEQGQP